jgi:asparagine synthase (glutamine-hydrolysing)
MALIEASKGARNNWSEIAGDISGLTGYQQMLTRFSKSNGFSSPLEGFIGITQRSDLDSGLFNVGREVQDATTSALVSFIAPTGVNSLSELHNTLLRYEVGKFLPSLLQVEDRVTMACGLESRVPLLSTEMLEFMLSLPLEIRLSGVRPKDLMRPTAVLQRKDKMGFPVPLDLWARVQAKNEVTAIISQLRDRRLSYIRNELLDNILLNPDLGNRSLWAALSLSTWLNNFES